MTLLAWLLSIWFFLAFLLLLLVTLSVPISKTIYMFSLAAQESSGLLDASASGNVTFGVWGYCISALQVSVLGIDAGTSAQCSQPKVGFTFDSAITDALHISSIADAVSGIVTAAQVLHPIACVLTFFAFLNTLADVLPNKRGTCHPSLRLAIVTVATLSTWLVFIIDINVLSAVRSAVNNSSDNVVTLSIGNGVWIVLAAAIGSLFALLWYLVQRCRGKPHKKVGGKRSLLVS